MAQTMAQTMVTQTVQTMAQTMAMQMMAQTIQMMAQTMACKRWRKRWQHKTMACK